VPEEFQPSAERLAATVLQPIRDRIKRSMAILSWYRSPALNFAVKGSTTSQHLRAEAADFTCEGLQGVFRDLLIARYVPCGQSIYYPAQQFIHVALPSNRYPEPTFCVHWPARGYKYHVLSGVPEFDRITKRAA